MKFISKFTPLTFVLVMATLLSFPIQAADIEWNNAGGDNDFSNALNWVGGVVPADAGNNAVINLNGADRAIFTAETNVNFDAIFVGSSGTGELDIAGGDLLVTKNTSRVTRVGMTGGTGTINHTAGRFRVNALEIGMDHEGAGTYRLSGGELEIRRTYLNASILVGSNGVGNFEVTGGVLTTRLGVYVGFGDGVGEFSVVGSNATTIGIGSSTSLDGDWVQSSTGTLKVTVDDGGLTPILIDDFENDGIGGDATFADGAMLDVGFVGSPVEGSWVVMNCEGVITNNGLSLNSEDVIAGWSFSIEDTGVNGDREGPDTLIVTYAEPDEGDRILKADGEILVLKVESGIVSVDNAVVSGPLKGSVVLGSDTVLDIDYLDTPTEGDFIALQWEGILVDGGLTLSAASIEGGWGMRFEDRGINGDIAGSDTLILTYSVPGVDFEIADGETLDIELDYDDFDAFSVGGESGTKSFSGDAIFEDGSLINVVPSGDVRNGSWAILSWKGDLVDGGLALPLELVEQGWSLSYEDNGVNVIGVDTLVLNYATPVVSKGRFTHPGIFHKRSDLERMRHGIEAGLEPWSSSYARMKNDSYAKYTYVVQGKPTYTYLDREGSHTEYKNQYESDMTAAYHNALMYWLSGDQRHADKAIEILNVWSNLKTVYGTPLNVGLYGAPMITAAELIKHSNAGWKEEDMQKFSDMLVYPGYSNTTIPQSDLDAENHTFYWGTYNGDSKRAGNQELAAFKTVMAIGIFLDNEIIYDRALRYVRGQAHRSDDLPYESGPSNPTTFLSADEYQESYDFVNLDTIPDAGFDGVLTNYILDNGQSAESSRDQTHAMYGVSLLTQISEMAWNQGDDLYSWADDRILVGLEYHTKYNVSAVQSYDDQLDPWEPDPEQGEFYQVYSKTGRTKFLKVNPQYRGTNLTRPYWEMPFNHYLHRTNLTEEDYKWLKRARDLNIERSGAFETRSASNTDHPGWGALAYGRPDFCAGDPVSGFEGTLPLYEMNQIPGSMNAANYDAFPGDGEEFTYHDSSIENTGGEYRSDAVDIALDASEGYVLTDLESGEWLTYTVNVASAGDYDLLVRYSSIEGGGTIRFAIGETSITEDFVLPANSGEWSDVVVAENVTLEAGVQALRVYIGGNAGSYELSNLQVIELSQFDVWKLENGIGVAVADSDDTDGNGVSVLLEYAMGLESGESNEFPKWTRLHGNAWSYSFKKARSELQYDVFVGASLPNGPWELLNQSPTATGDLVTYAYESANDTDDVFFKLRVSLPGSSDAQAITGLDIDPETLSLSIETPQSLIALVSPSDAADVSLVWSSSDQTVAIVDQSGLVTGRKTGVVSITCATDYGNYLDTCEVTVTNPRPVTGISVTPNALSLTNGSRDLLTAEIAPSDAVIGSVGWSSSDSSIVEVTATGFVIGRGVGTAIITATSLDGGFIATCEVTVVPK